MHGSPVHADALAVLHGSPSACMWDMVIWTWDMEGVLRLPRDESNLACDRTLAWGALCVRDAHVCDGHLCVCVCPDRFAWLSVQEGALRTESYRVSAGVYLVCPP